ncbi:MAG: pilus assembly PilX family protein, partial [Planctomycetota bacterium]
MTAQRDTQRTGRQKSERRGVTAILAMMFMIMFGSLATAMAIASKGNLRTAQTHMIVSRAMGAADTGVRLAESRLREASSSFRVERGVIDAAFADAMWSGTFTGTDGQVLLPDGSQANIGIRDFLYQIHATDNTTSEMGVSTGLPSDWAVTMPIVLESAVDNMGVVSTVSATQITYIPLGNDPSIIRSVVTGWAWDFLSDRWVSRTVQQDFEVIKRVEHVVLGPSKIMIGKNVRVEGNIGAIFTHTNNIDGHPLVVRSDFYNIDPALDSKLDDFYAAVAADDTDGDNRIRGLHAIEGQNLGLLNSNDYDGDSTADNAFQDLTNDDIIDEFDIFLGHYDTDSDDRVTMASVLTVGTPAELYSEEYAGVDDDLAMLIDTARPDRNDDGVVDAKDTALGYRDGFIDYLDQYAKVHGKVEIRATRADWENSPTEDGFTVDNYQPWVRGSIVPEDDDPPVAFELDDRVLPDVDTSTFDGALTKLAGLADGSSFETQAGTGVIWTPTTNADGVVIGQQFDPGIEIRLESTPFDSPAPADWYFRPVFRDTLFKDVIIPQGLNALFIDCTFVGVTRVESYQDNTHPAWQFYGQENKDGTLKFPPPPEFSDAQLDNDYFTPTIVKPASFDESRLTVGGTPYVNTKLLSNNIRFEDCTFVGSVVADKPAVYTHVRNKLQFTGDTKFFREHPDFPTDPTYNPQAVDQDEIDKSAMLLPHYSVDIGKNNASPLQDVNLQGLIIAGILDIRGKTSINGALLLTFDPDPSNPALMHFGLPAGNPANYNVTLGYFGEADGDSEGLAPFEYGGQQIVGFDIDGDGYVDTTE